MKVLVIDDTELHLQQAREQLVGHEVITVSSYEEAEDLLSVQHDAEFYETRYEELVGGGSSSIKAQDQAMAEAERHYEHFDAVLTDLMMSGNPNGASKKGIGMELPMGTILALLALKAGVKRVGVVTTNHHDHVATAAFDAFGYHKPLFCVGDAVILCTNDHSRCRDHKTGEWGNVLIKYWDLVLSELVEARPLS